MADWEIGMCGCFDNLKLCCLANIMAPLTIGKAVATFDEQDKVLWVLSAGLAPCCALGLARFHIRKKHGIEGSFCCDWFLSGVFQPCVINQLAHQTGVWGDLLPEDQSMNRVADGS